MKLRKGFIQGIEALMLAMLCHWTNADGAALFMGCLGLLMIFTRITKEDIK